MNKKLSKKPGFIYPGDLCFFKQPQEVYIADKNWEYNKNTLRIISPREHLFYKKRTREGRGGVWLHCFESYGLNYVFEGSIKEFTKVHPNNK